MAPARGWWGVLLLLAATAGSRAAAASIPFPAPANQSLGGLYLLPALGCDTSAPGRVGATRGFLLQGEGTGAPSAIPIDSGACWSPVRDAAARRSAEVMGAGPAGPLLSLTPRAYWVTSEAVLRARNGVPAGRVVRDVEYEALLAGPVSGGGGGDEQLLREAAALRLLTLQRNSMSGAVHRMLGSFDVAAVSRVTLGLCKNVECKDPSAVNVVGSRRLEYYNSEAIPLLLYTPKNGTGGAMPPLLVRMDVEDLLSLGRAVMSDRSWLSAAKAPSWRLRAGLTLYADSVYRTAGKKQAHVEPLGGVPWSRLDTVDLGNTSAAATARSEKWLQAVSYVLCASPLSSFVVTSGGKSRLCGPAADDKPPKPLEGGQSVRQMHSAEWSFDPDQKAHNKRPPEEPLMPGEELQACQASPERTGNPATQRVPRPAWLAGRADREVNPASAVEVDLARSISTCAYNVSMLSARQERPFQTLDRIKWDANSKYTPLLEATRELSESYDRKVWGVEPPPEASSDADIVLSVIVVLPEAIALLALLITTRKWGKRDWAVFLLIWVAGAVSIGGIISLAVEESVGHNWRAASVRTELSVRLHSTENTDNFRHFDKMPLFKIETLLLVASLGYRHRLLRNLAVGLATIYMLLSVVVAVVAFQRTQVYKSREAVESGSGGDPTHPHRRRPRWPRLLGHRTRAGSHGGGDARGAGGEHPGTAAAGV